MGHLHYTPQSSAKSKHHIKKKENTTMPKITIDGKEFDTEQLTEEARNQIVSIQFVDRKIQELKAGLAAYQTARNAYAKALTEILNKEQVQN
jgi:hypothetical protein